MTQTTKITDVEQAENCRTEKLRLNQKQQQAVYVPKKKTTYLKQQAGSYHPTH